MEKEKLYCTITFNGTEIEEKLHKVIELKKELYKAVIELNAAVGNAVPEIGVKK